MILQNGDLVFLTACELTEALTLSSCRFVSLLFLAILWCTITLCVQGYVYSAPKSSFNMSLKTKSNQKN